MEDFNVSVNLVREDKNFDVWDGAEKEKEKEKMWVSAGPFLFQRRALDLFNACLCVFQ